MYVISQGGKEMDKNKIKRSWTGLNPLLLSIYSTSWGFSASFIDNLYGTIASSQAPHLPSEREAQETVLDRAG